MVPRRLEHRVQRAHLGPGEAELTDAQADRDHVAKVVIDGIAQRVEIDGQR